MNLSYSRKRIENPRQKANFISKLFFTSTGRLFLNGYKKDLSENDIYRVLPSYESKELGHKLEKEWTKQAKKNRSSVPLLLLKCFGREYFLVLLTLIIALILTAARPLIVKRFILYFTPGHNNIPKIEAYGYGALVIFALLVEAMYRHNMELALVTLAYKIRAGFTSLIYRRVLKLELARLDGVSVGKIINLITKDVAEFEDSVSFITNLFINGSNTVVLCCVLYSEVGWLVMLLVAMIVVTVSVNSFLAILVTKIKSRTLKETDRRLQTTKEVLGAITLIKSYLWSGYYGKKLEVIRKKEVSNISKIYILYFVKIVLSSTVIDASWYIIVVGMIFSGTQSNVGTLFLILNSINSLQLPLQQIMPRAVHHIATMVAVCKRIARFLKDTDSSFRRNNDTTNIPLLDTNAPDLTDLEYIAGLTVITGPVGSGKSSLLKAIAKARSEDKTFSYASQEPWLFPSTVKQNILFGSNYDDERYLEVLRVCALLDDLRSLEGGDSLVVADRGSNLSKGQQARINLARAVYKNRDVYLFDDCLSHLDVLTANFIFEECFRNFLKERIVFLVTQNVEQIDKSDKVVTLENFVAKTRTRSENKLASETTPLIEKDIKTLNNREMEILIKKIEVESNIYKEANAHGGVKLATYKKYLDMCGGWYRFFIVVFLIAFIQVMQVSITKLEALWIRSEQILSRNSTKDELEDALENRLLMLSVLPILILSVSLVFIFTIKVYWVFIGKSSMKIHKLLLSKVLNASAHFFNCHFVGNILNRFSEDMLYFDEFLPRHYFQSLKWFAEAVAAVILVATLNIHFLIGCTAFIFVVVIIRIVYLRTGRALKRLEFSTRSPLLGHINATLEGLATIKISQRESFQCEKFDKYQDLYTSCSYMCIWTEKAFHFFADACAVCFTTSVIVTFLLLSEEMSSDKVGLGLLEIYKFTLAQYLLFRDWSRIETYMTTVERILQYTKQQQESKDGVIVENWPLKGEIQYKHVHFAYSSINSVLTDVNFIVPPMSKIAIVGRTASGKSSLTSILLRLYDFKGRIYIDDVDISTLDLNLLRSNISVISQEPTLFSGTLRENVDPTNKFADSEIWKAVEAVHLSMRFQSLEDEISGQDANLSTGQKQLICLCRALVRNSKIVILDEVTASVDSALESVIYDIVSKNFKASTVVLVTHKLQYVLQYDKILVLDKGRVAEFGDPRSLLKNENGLFYKMYNQKNN